MLVGLSGYLAGYNGSFEFKSGEKYPEEVDYTFMRLFNSAFGAMCIPLAYYTARELNFRRTTVWLVTLMVLFENSYATISRFILLDSMLLFFTFTTTLCWARFHRLQHKSFSAEWFAWLFATGVSIGCVCSVKWVGLFCTGLVGLYTAEDLWNKFGDLDMPFVRTMRPSPDTPPADRDSSPSYSILPPVLLASLSFLSWCTSLPSTSTSSFSPILARAMPR